MGYEIFEVQRLMPWITALPVKASTPGSTEKTTPINLNTASEELLLALGGNLDRQFRDFVMSSRPFEDVLDFHRDLAIDLQMPQTDVERRWPDTLVGVVSDFFQSYVEVMLGEARIEVRSIIMRSSPTDSVIIHRELTTVPSSVDKNSTSEMLGKLLAGSKSDKESEEIIDDQQVLPACVTIGA